MISEHKFAKGGDHMSGVSFLSIENISEDQIKYVVAAVRYQQKWLFSRHKLRNTWDMPGGHIEPGETADQAMERELWEETGAIRFQLQPLSVYAVQKDNQCSYGMLYIADVSDLSSLPAEYEMEEVCLLDLLPDVLTYPDILPELFSYVQGWLNLQCNPDEKWDVYDADRNRTGKLHRRGDPLAAGEYHLVVHVWIQNPDGQFLLTKRSPNKGFPNMWEATGGSALAGDDSLTAALREVREETGLTLEPTNGKCILRLKGRDFHRDVWLFRQNISLDQVLLQPGETVDKMLADKEKVLQMGRAGLLVPYGYLEELFRIIDLD